MHKYLRSIGFSNIKHKSDANELIDEILLHPDNKYSYKYKSGQTLHQYEKFFGYEIGLSLIGEWGEGECPQADNIYPMFLEEDWTSNAPFDIEPISDRDGFYGIAEDNRVEISLIFNVQNIIETKDVVEKTQSSRFRRPIVLTGLSLGGKVLFPVTKNQMQIQNSKRRSETRSKMVGLARQGNEQAIENLTLSDIDTYTEVARRISREDVFSVVDSFFMPYGVETDKYSVLGDILAVKEEVNPITKEELYMMLIECNEMRFRICMNKEDLLGEPKVGRRFKGNIWLQGRILYDLDNQ